MTEKLKCVALFSGGLDSRLAIRLIQEQGIEVHALHFEVLFSPRYMPKSKKITMMEEYAKKEGFYFYYIDIVDEYIENVLTRPKWGYGKSINPCVDCHAYMLRKAGEFMEKIGAKFIITGEVLGERPMSQRKDRLYLVAKESGYRDYILRPLSAKLLKETLPEREGWVNRDKLEGISGRSRKRQMELAQKFAITEYPSPAGGCAYTEKNFGIRVRDFMEHEGIDAKRLCLAKVGRHFRGNGFRLILGRKHSENLFLDNIGKDEWRVYPKGFGAPTGLILPLDSEKKNIEVPQEIQQIAANLIVRYGNKEESGEVILSPPGVERKDGKVIVGKRKEFSEMGLVQL